MERRATRRENHAQPHGATATTTVADPLTLHSEHGLAYFFSCFRESRLAKVAIATNYAVEVYYGGVWNQYGGEVAPNVLSEVVTGLNPGTTYYFDVLWYSGQNAIREEVIPFAVTSLPIFNSGVMHPVAPGNYQAVDGVLFGSGGPKYADVQQNTLGDCWLLASLAETAAKDPALITNMFTYLGWWSENGVPTQLYDVRLNEYSVQGSIAYGTGVVCTELVDTEFDVYQGQFYGASIFGGIEWVALAEKAYVQAASQGYVLNSYGKTNAPCPDNYGDVVGGSPAWRSRCDWRCGRVHRDRRQ